MSHQVREVTSGSQQGSMDPLVIDGRNRGSLIYTINYVKILGVNIQLPSILRSETDLSLPHIYIISEFICISFYQVCISPKVKSCLYRPLETG